MSPSLPPIVGAHNHPNMSQNYGNHSNATSPAPAREQAPASSNSYPWSLQD
ncbi:hypothetical protein K443DRAFT_4689 [Laccaria amethystina LaAM-08-1]|uniref:Uncharacterized protein n=1 Tax=Laccaria amethystina LaAM-08-1 TaxID=1095629 RepID=A0A0C9Y2S2_9AGAR|nr:hypothetical protein K443DRAFT_4689 [Laccaria amethystina LaAM-08-1]